MNKRLTDYVMILAVLALAILVPGCGSGLPDDVRQEAATLSKTLDRTADHIQSQKEKFTTITSRGDFSSLAEYAARENWEGEFQKAGQILARGKDLYKKELAPLLKEDRPEDAPRVKVQITRIQSAVQEAKAAARTPFDRMERIRSAMTDTEAIYNQARENGDAVLGRISRLEQGPLAEAMEKFPDSSTLIAKRFSPFAKLAADTRATLTGLEYQFQAHTGSGSADYAAFADAAAILDRAAKEMAQKGPKFETDIGQLYLSYTKVLQDMKVDYFLIIKRESWDEGSDYYDPKSVIFTRKVSPAVYEALADSPLESIAEIVPSWGGGSFKNNISSNWEGLEINPTENWPDRRHNAASFWIEETREDFYHKYLQETNGETKETGWIKVNPSFYEQNLDNLGMAILSKPYGEFEPDPVAAPPGMAYVGNPQYGEWKKDDSGNSFWSWYGRYAFFSHLFFFPPSYYSYGSWNSWRTGYRHQKPYYGKTSSGQNTYGTSGTKIKGSPRYQNTTFAKTGGFKTAPASVRGGSASLRGGGPKGKGK